MRGYPDFDRVLVGQVWFRDGILKTARKAVYVNHLGMGINPAAFAGREAADLVWIDIVMLGFGHLARMQTVLARDGIPPCQGWQVDRVGGIKMKLRAAFWMLLLAVTVASPGCVGFGLPKMANNHRLPPAQRLMEPGPGVGGPGPGVLTPPPPSAAHASLSMGGPGGPPMGPPMGGPPTVQITFNKPESMKVQWDVGGVGKFDSDPLIVPGRQNFPEGAIYRLKVSGIPGREGVELYPSLEIARTTPRTAAYLAHNAIPIQFGLEDWDQVLAGNFVTKVVYLPDPDFQKLAVAGVEMLVSTRLDPGVDPIVEADQRGSIMAIIRIGNKDIELPGTNRAGGVVPAAYGMVGGPAVPMGAPPTLPARHLVSGFNVPQYGMTMSGTPIGLPGPPHIPMGHGVSLQKHVIRNHTMHHLPKPPKKFVIHARQQPGYSYPKAPSRMYIREQSIHPSLPYGPPRRNRTQLVR